jgi:23S rRNA U2552 (ribose-2'-O)-methylase RlmE/FtsJ
MNTKKTLDNPNQGKYMTPNSEQIQQEFDVFLNYVKNKKIILEIGTNQGGTLYQMMQVAAEDAEIISIDILPDGVIPPPMALMQSWKKPKQILHILRMDSHKEETLKEVKKILHGRRIDIAFIDGDHSEEGISRDYDMYGDLCDIIGFHDICHEPVKKVWCELNGEKIEFIHEVSQVWGGIGCLIS